MKKYSWVLKLVGAAILIGLAVTLEFANGEPIVVAIIGALMIIYAVVRLVPFVKTQGSDLIKTINIIEITLDVVMGAGMIAIEFAVDGGIGSALGYIIGVYLILRGMVHFYGVSEGKEKSDLVLYFFHVAALVVGGIVIVSGNIDPAIIIHGILAISLIIGGFLIYDGGKGFSQYRKDKVMEDSDSQSDQSSDQTTPEVTILDEEKEQPNIVA